MWKLRPRVQKALIQGHTARTLVSESAARVVRACLLQPSILLWGPGCRWLAPSLPSPLGTPAECRGLDKNYQPVRTSHESTGQRRKSAFRELALLGSGHIAQEMSEILFPVSLLWALSQLLPSLTGLQGSSTTRPQGTCRKTLWSHRYPMATGGQRGNVSSLPGWAHRACLGPRLLARLR